MPRHRWTHGLVLLLMLWPLPLFAQRVKDIARVQGIRQQHMKGIGLVTGLAGTGDSERSSLTKELYAAVLEHLEISIPAKEIRSRNVATVMVTVTVPSSTKVGSIFDITISSIGDAKSLKGGWLLETPLFGPGEAGGQESPVVYGIAQGSVRVEGGTLTVGRGQAILEEDISIDFVHDGTFTVILNRPDFSTATRVARAIREFPFLRATIGAQPAGAEPIAHALDGGSVRVRIPSKFHAPNKVIDFISRIMGEVFVPTVDREARVIIYRESGIVAVNGNVRVSPVVIQLDEMTLHIPPRPKGVAPGAVPQEPHPFLIDVMAELEQGGIVAKQMPAIIRSIHDAGALVGKLVEK
ncbi:MAG: flagellar basal body P-ring protein FlgI [Planctomycetota bacterium]